MKFEVAASGQEYTRRTILKILHLNTSDSIGGAARATYRIHAALRDLGVDSTVYVNNAGMGDWTVEGPSSNFDKLMAKIKPRISGLLQKLMATDNKILHSLSIFPSPLIKKINKSNVDLVHLHWVQGEMLSVKDVAKIKKPIVWTVHDMWAFCGAEHLAADNRWREGYRRNNRPAHESGVDLNRWTWLRKRKHWSKPMQMAAPSRWLADCVQSSALMRDWPVSVVANPLNTERWKPFDQKHARELLCLPAKPLLVLFGSYDENQANHKGFGLLLKALEHLREDRKTQAIELVVFGQRAPKHPPNLGFPVHYTGLLHDDFSLRALYSAADVMVVPSRQESFGQTASEAMACGTPVVAFACTGLLDIVDHQMNGYLAKPYDPSDLAKGIEWVLSHPAKQHLAQSARDKVVTTFDSKVIAQQYVNLYKSVLQ